MKINNVKDGGGLVSVRGIKVRGRAFVDDIGNQKSRIHRKEAKNQGHNCPEDPFLQAPSPAVLQGPKNGIAKAYAQSDVYDNYRKHNFKTAA